MSYVVGLKALRNIFHYVHYNVCHFIYIALSTSIQYAVPCFSVHSICTYNTKLPCEILLTYVFIHTHFMIMKSMKLYRTYIRDYI